MKTRARMLTLLFAASTALIFLVVLGGPAPGGLGQEDQEFDEASIFFELNHTDGDLGIHALIDGDPWKELEIQDHRGQDILEIDISGTLRRQGLTEVFFESAEPSFDELRPTRFFRRFPEGEYEIEGETLEGNVLESTVEVTHLLPAPPGNVRISGIPAAEDCDADPLPSISGPVIISWDPVTRSHPELGRTNEEIEVVKYQVVVEEEDLGLVLSADLPPTVTELEIPPGFIALSEEWKFEIVVREVSGNQTAVESCFTVE